MQLLQAVTGYNPNSAGANNAAILLCGVAKMYVGELIEEGEVGIACAGQKNFPSNPLRDMQTPQCRILEHLIPGLS